MPATVRATPRVARPDPLATDAASAPPHPAPSEALPPVGLVPLQVRTPPVPDRRHRSLSDVLESLAAFGADSRITVACLLRAAGDRAFGALLFIFAVPNVLPAPPGTSVLLGIPLILLSAQLAWGRPSPWLPRILAERSVDRAVFARVMTHVLPRLRRMERVLRPRWTVLTSRPVERLIGVAAFVLAVVIFLPVPLGNVLPAAAICAMALGLLEHDGVGVLLGAVLGVLSGLLVAGTLYAIAFAALATLRALGLWS